MYDGSIRKIVVFIAGLFYAIRQVNIFPIHEIIFIQQSHFPEHVGAQQHECSGQHIDFMIFIFIEVTEVILSKPSGMRE